MKLFRRLLVGAALLAALFVAALGAAWSCAKVPRYLDSKKIGLGGKLT